MNLMNLYGSFLLSTPRLSGGVGYTSGKTATPRSRTSRRDPDLSGMFTFAGVPCAWFTRDIKEPKLRLRSVLGF